MHKWIKLLFLLSFVFLGSLLYSESLPTDNSGMSIRERYATQEQISDSQDSFAQGYYYFNNMAYEAAISFFRSALSVYPKNDLAAYWLGKAYEMAGYTDLAVETWETLYKSNPQNLFLQQELSKLYVTDLRSVFSGKEPAMYRFAFLRMINTFANPSFIASDAHNNFYISDYYKNFVNVYDSNLRKLFTLKQQINKPANLAFHQNLLYVASFGNDTVQVFDMGNHYKYLYSIGGFGIENGKFAGPMGLAFFEDKLYVVDQGNNRVQIFQTTPKPYFIGSFGHLGDGEGEFRIPTGIVVYHNKVWVLDSQNHRIQIFDLDGNYLDQISSPKILNPIQAFVFQERMYVLDKENGLFSLTFEANQAPSFTLLQSPTEGLQKSTAAWIDNNGILFLSDVGNPTVVAYAREADKLSPLDIQPVFITTNSYPHIVIKLRAKDATGRDIRGLTAEDFVVTQDGTEINGAYVSPVIPENNKVTLTIVLRNMKDMYKNNDSIVKYIRRIIDSMESGDRIRIMVYNTHKTVVQSFTGSPLQLRESLARLPWMKDDAGQSPDILDEVLYDAVDSNEFNDSYNAILLIDNPSPAAFQKYSAEVIASHAKKVGIPIYTVNMDTRTTSSKGEMLPYLAKTSGGRAFSFSKSNDLFNILDIVRQNNPLFYTLSYTNPPIEEGLHGYWANIVIRLNYRSLEGVTQLGYLVGK